MSSGFSTAPLFGALLLFLALSAPADVRGAPCNPNATNCLPSCKYSCRTEKCLYNCHYDTSLEVLRSSITPPGGANIDAFTAAVSKVWNLLDDNVVVRIEPLGVYRGKAEVADYVATFVHPLGLSSRARIDDVQITHFANTGNVTGLTFNLLYSRVDDPTQTNNLTGIMFNYFDNATQRLVRGDWSFLRFPQFQEDLFKPEPRVSDKQSATIIKAVCGINEQVCRPAGVSGYDNVTDCMTFMASIPRIALYGIQGNNQYCRFLHMAYATVDPKVHCPHMGRTGGGVCVDQVYRDYYKVFPRGAFIGRP